MADVTHRQVKLDGIELHLAELGEGQPVIMLHGFPELWYAWRHQLPVLAEAGYQAIAADMRGYGGSSIPEEVEAYSLPAVCDDFVRLLDELGHEQAVFVGHDWGAAVTWHMALAHPERVTALVAMSVPFLPRLPVPPVPALRENLGEDFYMVWFQEPGVADEALARDVRRTLTTTKQWTPQWAEQEDDEPPRPPFMTEDDLRLLVETYERTGFSGGLGYYRNLDRNWELSADLAERRIEQPALFIAGSRDPVLQFMPPQLMRERVTDLREQTLEGAGHWIQQERPGEVNRELIGFLKETVGY